MILWIRLLLLKWFILIVCRELLLKVSLNRRIRSWRWVEKSLLLLLLLLLISVSIVISSWSEQRIGFKLLEVILRIEEKARLIIWILWSRIRQPSWLRRVVQLLQLDRCERGKAYVWVVPSKVTRKLTVVGVVGMLWIRCVDIISRIGGHNIIVIVTWCTDIAFNWITCVAVVVLKNCGIIGNYVVGLCSIVIITINCISWRNLEELQIWFAMFFWRCTWRCLISGCILILFSHVNLLII